MKTNSKIILISVLSALILAGCNKETEIIDKIETAVSAVSEQKSGGTEKKIIETEGDTQYILGGETEASADESGTAASETEDAPAELSARVFDYAALNTDTDDTENTIGNLFIKDGILAVDYSVESEDSFHVRLRFYGIEENKQLAEIDMPEGFGAYEMITETNDGILCKYIVSNSVFDEESGVFNSDYAAVTVHNDFTYEISDGYAPQDVSREVCGHNIAERDPDITDADSGEVLVVGRAAASDDDFSGTRQMYYFPIDENRFVYRTAGYESLPGFGIYDFSSGTAADVPQSENLVPLGVRGGKIYSVKTRWDGYGTELYVTDAETLETEFFWDFPDEVQANDYIEYAMPESGNYIALKYLSADEGKPALLYAIDPDAKEYTSEDIPDELKYYSLKRSSGNYVTVSNNDSKLLIAEINF